VPSVLEGVSLDKSLDFQPAPNFQLYAAEQLCRFIDSETSFSVRELCAVDICLSGSSHDERRAWWEQVRRCRRRAQARPMPLLPVAALLVPPTQRYQARLEGSVTKVRAILKRRGLTAQQVFKQWAGRGVHLSTAELASGLQQLGPVDAVEAGRLAMAAARQGDGTGENKDAVTSLAGFEPVSVTLAGFARVIGAAPGESTQEEDEAVASATAAPQATLDETAISMTKGRWSVRIVSIEKFTPVWSSARVPGEEARPFSIWRPDLRGGATSGLLQGLRTLVRAGAVRQFSLGDIAAKGFNAPGRTLVLQVKAAGHPPSGNGAGLGLTAWLTRYLPRPVAFRLLWRDRRGAEAQTGSGGNVGEGLFVWRPVPPSDLFVALGAICTTDSAEPRDVEVRCVPRAWLVRGDSLGPTLWSLGERREVRVQEDLGGVIACPTENLKYLPSWAFIAEHFYAGT